ncbi:hypothetical protein [Simplicispira psychrophila]|uniref:hypothetical protein n=1 Tax=Simplicispira psychrophila TaxID=80882 RepID=UPI0004838543|nr:hypothetical protein [Simplicispira psychrophila]
MTFYPHNPGSLIASALGLIRQPAVQDARTALDTVPCLIDFDLWVDDHEALAYQLVHITVKGAGQQENVRVTSAAVDHALAQLMNHAHLITNKPRPLLLAKDGVHTIPYERLAEARAKVQVLLVENAELRAKLAANAQEQRP